MKLRYKIIASIVGMVCSFTLGWTLHSCQPKPKPIIKEKIKYVTVTRDYENMSCEDYMKALMCYDKGVPVLDIMPLDNRNKYQMIGGLCERRWTRDITIQAGESGNWKLYLGIGIGVAGAAAITYGIYRLTK